MLPQLTLELPDETYQTMRLRARWLGTSVEEWTVRELKRLTMSREERETEVDRLMSHPRPSEMTIVVPAETEAAIQSVRAERLQSLTSKS